MHSGVEATMSEYDRLTGIKHLRVRGLNKVRFCAILKGIGINIFRATRVKAARAKRARENLALLPGFIALIQALKTISIKMRVVVHRILRWIAAFSIFFQLNSPNRFSRHLLAG